MIKHDQQIPDYKKAPAVKTTEAYLNLKTVSTANKTNTS